MQMYDVEIKEVYRCVASVMAESKDDALVITKNLYEAGVLELGNEDISETEYLICEGGV